MVLDTLSEGLRSGLKKLAQAVFVNTKVIDDLVRDLQRALLQADVNVRLVMELTQRIKQRATSEQPAPGLSQREHLLSVVYDELVKLFGTQTKGLDVGAHKPFVILLVGLFGNGKTTTAGKLAKYYVSRGSKVALVGLDVHRPAAMDQLQQVAKAVGVDSYTEKKQKDFTKIWKSFSAHQKQYDVIIVDSAGRDALNDELVQEIENVVRVVKPHERLLVINADIGQTARAQAEQFHKSCSVTGIVVTKLDGTAKGGGSITACAVTGAPIIFLGVGEKPGDLETFDPPSFVGRLLGMGDLRALLEKAEGAMKKEDVEELGQRMLQGEFNFLDLYSQIEAMKNMGPLNKVLEMIPGLGGAKLPKEMLSVQDEKFKKWKHILLSCTKEELENPDLLGRERIERIARGSGVTVGEVRELLKQYKQTKKVMKLMKGDPQKMMKRFGLKGLPTT